MNDKERILMTLIDRLTFTQTLCLRGTQESQFSDSFHGQFVHFGGYDDRPVRAGDLVLAVTGGIDQFKIGWVHEVVSDSNCIIREIGTNHLCNYGNERFQRIVGLDPELLLEGNKYKFKVKVLKAFRDGNEYSYRYGGISFPAKGVAEISIREVFGGLPKPSKPFTFQMDWSAKTPIKRILKAMREAGYGTRQFELADTITNEEENSR